MREKYQTEIEKRISEFERDYAFTAVDFADIADTDPANKALSRLSEEGTIKRIIQGVYYKPVYSKLLNEYRKGCRSICEKVQLDDSSIGRYSIELSAFIYSGS